MGRDAVVAIAVVVEADTTERHAVSAAERPDHVVEYRVWARVVARVPARQTGVVDDSVEHGAATLPPGHRLDQRVEHQVGASEEATGDVDPGAVAEGDAIGSGIGLEVRLADREEVTLMRGNHREEVYRTDVRVGNGWLPTVHRRVTMPAVSTPDEPKPAPDTQPDADEPLATRSSRDPEDLRARLEAWLQGTVGDGVDVRVTSVEVPSSNGMSSETLLFDAEWTEAGGAVARQLVARVAPDPGDVPVFPDYDLEAQFKVINLVAAHSAVPVPKALWLETDVDALGAEFFVMERVDGRVPPDVMPYNMGSWLMDASREEQRALQDASVAVLAAIHAIDPASVDAAFLEIDAPGDTALRRHVAHWRAYYDWVRGDERHPLLEAAFEWLDENWPDDEGDTVISWGDARIGNMMYDGFTPAAVLDWEMASLAPRGVDLGWMVFLHSFFEFIARQMEMEGMPHFLRSPDVVATYEACSGVPVSDMAWYEVYAALRHGIVMARVHARQVHFGEAEWPADPDDAVLHRPVIEQMLDGSYWS
jgi:aminoglycoside phosphotransferase (APT) family kinase protein